MKKKLSKALQVLIKQYITNRNNQANGVEWNKAADVLAIEVQAKADGFINTESCCGTWWFNYRRSKSRWVFECNETNYTVAILGKRHVPFNVGSHALAALSAIRA
jgi:hypothetical protein